MRKVICILAALVLSLSPLWGQKASMKRLESQRAQLEKDIALLNRKLEQNAKSNTAALGNLTLLRSKIQAREKLIAGCDATIGLLDDSLRVCKREMDRLQARHDTLALYYGRLVRGAYKNRDSRLWYMYILASESIGQGLRRASYLRGLSADMNRQAVELREMSAQLAVEKERLDGLRASAADMRSKVSLERKQLKGEESDASRLVSQLDKDRKKYQAQLQEKNRQKEALNRRIAELIRQQAAAAKGSSGKSGGKAPGKTTSTVVDTKLSNEFASNKGRLPWPVEGAVVERFGKHNHPVYQNVELPQNNGVTLAVKSGAQAKAVFNGKVTQIVVLPGYNQCVLVGHGEYFTLYSKLKSVAVKVGQKVSTGDVVGIVDTIGGEDLFHFELWKGTTPQNPETWLRD